MNKWLKLLIFWILFVAADQFTKYLAMHGLGQNIVLIPGVFELQYVENQGAAFGILQNRILFFVIVTLIMIGVLLYAYARIPAEKGYGWFRFCMILILSGAIGNLIDRAARGYVVDFLYFKLIDFPTFNVADCYVVVGAFLLLFLSFLQKERFNTLMASVEKQKEPSDE